MLRTLSTYKGLPLPGERLCAVYTATYRNGRVIFAGGPFGSTSIDAGDIKRVNAHWAGYVSNCVGRDKKPRGITKAALDAAKGGN